MGKIPWPYIQLTASMVIAGSTVVVGKLIIARVPVFLASGLRFDFAALNLIDWLLMLYFGLVVTVVAFILWYSALAQVPASTAAVFFRSAAYQRGHALIYRSKRGLFVVPPFRDVVRPGCHLCNLYE